MRGLQIPVNGRLITYEECQTDDEREYWQLVADKRLEDARDILAETQHHNNGEGL
jgi:hypothetical protein